MTKRGFPDIFRVRLRGDWCIYCGEPAQTDEHFPPKSYTMRGVIIPACRECNLFAGTAYCADFAERARHVHTKLRKKYGRLLAVPEWSQEEIAETGPGIKSVLKRWKVEVSDIKRRLAWDAVSYLRLIDRSGEMEAASAEMAKAIARDKKRFRKAVAKAEPATGAEASA